MMAGLGFHFRKRRPAGVLGALGEKLGAGSRFEKSLQHDLDNFARMVDQAPPGALDPESSNYLFHSGSAAAKGQTTSRQNATMGDEYSGTTCTPTDHPETDQDIIQGGPDKGFSPEPTRPPDDYTDRNA